LRFGLKRIFYSFLIIIDIRSQLRELLESNAEKHTEILEIIKKFRDEEQDHHDLGLEHEAEKVLNAHIFRLTFYQR